MMGKELAQAARASLLLCTAVAALAAQECVYRSGQIASGTVFGDPVLLGHTLLADVSACDDCSQVSARLGLGCRVCGALAAHRRCMQLVTLPFAVLLHCQRLTELYVSANGMVHTWPFPSGSNVATNANTPLPNSTAGERSPSALSFVLVRGAHLTGAAVLWDDWSPQLHGDVYMGWGGTAPSRVLYITWYEVQVRAGEPCPAPAVHDPTPPVALRHYGHAESRRSVSRGAERRDAMRRCGDAACPSPVRS